MKAPADWNVIRARLAAGTLSKEDEQILGLLVAGQSTPTIARAMKQHRSMIWRKVESLRRRAAGDSS